MKTLSFVKRGGGQHWVGDGFPVRSVFSYNDLAHELSPFLLLDHAGPAEFPPSPGQRRGVGEHPHRGFETVTIVYDGEVEHRDSAGGGGLIGPGDVQWMTAASGIVHQEYHGPGFAERGGRFEMIQLWVNLAARDKSAAPRYQNITDGDIPSVAVPGGKVRVIAGAFGDAKGPALTFSPMSLLDIRLKAGASVPIEAPEGHTAAVLVLDGTLDLPDGETARAGELAVFNRVGADIALTARIDAKLFVMTGEPIDEPIVGYGPFVMNTEAEIRQAIVDYQNGRMGSIAAESVTA